MKKSEQKMKSSPKNKKATPAKKKSSAHASTIPTSSGQPNNKTIEQSSNPTIPTSSGQPNNKTTPVTLSEVEGQHKTIKIKSSNLFPVVGIGASAGGLDAFKKLLKAIPENSGMAYVLVQHLDPKHESLLPEILQKVTKIPVMEITDDIKVLPNHIYIIPSNKMMVANDGVLQLSPRTATKNERHLPVNICFISLAEVYQTSAIGVVLSGKASDGTLGLKAIKDHGGITFAQDQESAAYEGMPNSAAQAGVVDFILPPEQIPQKILEVTNITLGNGNGTPPSGAGGPDEEVFKQMLSLLRIRKGTDFTYYKQTTIRRRILRRMALNKNEEPGDYLKYLRENKPEQDVLYQDLLIPVTGFFRDPKTFENICESVFPFIAKNKIAPSGTGVEPIRIWVAGCSTGEEAYSIAICLKEYLSNLTPGPSPKERGANSRNNSGNISGYGSLSFGEGRGEVQIFATDISEPAIAKARHGIYTKAELDAVSPHRLQEFFTKTNGSYQVNKNIRDMCVFAHHNFLKDPPFGKMDFISCRNVLIYMEPYLQKKALTTFHYSLNPKRFLLLGKSETISSVPNLFAANTKSDKLFSRKDAPARFMHVASQRSELNFSGINALPRSEPTRSDFQKTADDIMLNRYTPAGVVVNEAMDIVHFRGNTSNYLAQSPGKPSHNLLQMSKHGLAFELRNILHKAKKEKAPVIKENIPLEINGSLRTIAIEALLLPNTIEPHYLILFHDMEIAGSRQSAVGSKQQAAGKKQKAVKQDDKDLRIAQLEQELSQAREDMRSITEDQEAANEELQSANEKLLSGSEELQTLNEELETGKEELQSTNEELTVVNQEMIALNEQVTEEKNYSETIIANHPAPLLVLDSNLRIKTANIAFYKTFLVNETETEDRLVYQLGNNQWDIPALRKLLENILPQKSMFEGFEISHNFETIGQRTMLLNAREILRKSQPEKLILLSIEDITAQKLYQVEEKKFLSSYYNLLVQTPIIIAVFRGNNYIVELANDYALGVVVKDQSFIGQPLLQSMPELEGQQVKQILDNVMQSGIAFIGNEFEVTIFRNGQNDKAYFNVIYQPIVEEDKTISGIIAAATEVTEQVLSRKKIEESQEQFSTLANNIQNLAWMANADGWIYWYNNRWYEFTGTTPAEMEGWGWKTVHDPEQLPFVLERWQQSIKDGNPFEMTFPLRGADGMFHFFLTRVEPMRDNQGKVIRWIGTNTDITEQIEAKNKIENQQRLYKAVTNNTPDLIYVFDLNYRFTYANEALLQMWGETWDNAIGKGLRQLGYEEWHALMHEKEIDQVAATKKPIRGEVSFPHATAGIRVYDYIFTPVLNHNGEVEAVTGTTRDITERVEYEQKIKESEEQFSTLADNISQLAWMADEKGWIYWYNQRWYDFTGTTLETMQGWGWQAVHHPDMVDGVTKRFKAAIETGTDWEDTFLLRGKDGTYQWFLSRAVPIRDNDGKILRWFGTNTDVTGQKVTQSLLEYRKALLEAHNEASVDGILLVDAKGKILSYNKRFIEIWNMPQHIVDAKDDDAALSFAMTQLVHPQQFIEKVKHLYAHPDEICNDELEFTNGKIIERHGYPVIAPDGSNYAWSWAFRDITEARNADIAIRLSEQNFRQLADLMPEKVTNTDAAGNVTYFNKNWLDYTGLSFEELKGWGWEKIMHPEDMKINIPLWRDAIEKGIPLQTEERIKNKNGEYRWHLSRVSPVTDSNGKITKWISATTEIQEQKDQREVLEKAIRESTQELVTVNESLQQANQEIALSVYNKKFLTEFSERFAAYKYHDEFFYAAVLYIAELTHIDYVFVGKLEQPTGNQFAIQTIALSAFGKSVDNINYPLPDGPCEQVIQGKLYSYPENCMLTFPKNKTIADFKVEGYIGYPLYDAQEKAIGLIAVMHSKKIEDPETVSSILKIVAKRAEIEMERIKYEKALEQNNKSLEEKNTELQNMNKELEAFTYVASHDLQEPLRKIQTFAGRILKKENQNLSDSGKDYFHRLQEASKRMQTLIQDLLAFSRLTTAERKFENTGLGKIVKETVNDLKEVIDTKRAIIKVGEMCEVKIIPFQFRQLMTNLISNALKFSNPEIPPHITITASPTPPKEGLSTAQKSSQPGAVKNPTLGGRGAHISVTDNGIGFEKEFSEKIFEVFQKLHGKEEYAGTGIGLAIVKKIVDNHNGIITATSELGKGARFDIYIPAT